MELLSLNFPFAPTRLPSLRRAATERFPFFSGQTLTSPIGNSTKCPLSRNAAPLDLRLRPSVSVQVAADSSSKTGETIMKEMSSKDNCLVFVAGATGKVGSRTVRELLKLGFRVRAGVRSIQRAETLVQSVRQMKLDGISGNSETQPVEKLEIVECDLENESSIRPAIGSASVIICCIGASEKEVFDVTGPYRIDYKATKNLIEAATVAEVDHFILLTSLGTNKIGFPAAILNLFWGVLCWKRKAEEALITSGLPYTIVRPGGMERPTDSYKETHNIVLASEDTYFGGQVSNLQVAELMACMAKNRILSFCKVVEVIAETTAPLTPMEVLLAKIPSKRDPPPEPTLDPVSLEIDPEPTSSAAEKKSGDGEVSQIKPLSPFFMYDDLKPPTSPTPTPSTTPLVQAEKKSATTTTTATSTPKTMHLSPYIMYDDLKPPTSPTPKPPIFAKGLSDGSTSISQSLKSEEGNDAERTTMSNVTDNGLPQNSSHQSPFSVYEDLKPPTSPSPNVPYFISASAGPDDSTLTESGDKKHPKQQNSRPLSPYTMYDDLKPPCSPLPSVPKY